MNKLEAAARQALEALESKLGETHPFAHSLENAAARRALREALDHSGEANEMVIDWEAIGKEQLRRYKEKFGDFEQAKQAEIPEWVDVDDYEEQKQEPVAEVVLRSCKVGFGHTEERKDISFLADVEVGTKLYAAPVQQAEQEHDGHWSDCSVHNEPAYPNGPCDCGGYPPKPWKCACGANLYIDSNGAPASKAEQAEQEPVAIGSVLQKVMARLADLLDDDQFNNINGIVEDAGYAAPVELVKQEPVAWKQIGIGDCEGTTILVARLPTEYNKEWWRFDPLYAAPVQQEEQEPVAWGVDWGKDSDRSCVSIIKKHSDGTTEVVAIEHSPNPVRTKDLTDAEIWEIVDNTKPTPLDFARSVIAADREKNK